MQRACLNGSLLEAVTQPKLHRNQNYFATVTAIGELHLRLGTASGLNQNAAKLMSGIQSYVEDSDEIITSLSDGVSDHEKEDTSVLK